MIYSCDICGNDFQKKMSSQKRCSSACRKEHHRRTEWLKIGDKSWRKEINCSICNSVFFPKMHNTKMCSTKCRRIYRTEKMRTTAAKKIKIYNNVCCIECGSEFKTVGKSKTITCSKKCSHKNKIRDAHKRPYRSTPTFKMYSRIRTTINTRIRTNARTSDICSYTARQLKDYIESKFRDGMTWDNYGRFGWHIDHIKPLSAFQFFDERGNVREDQIRECMSLDNLQPLWREENIRKGGLRKMKTEGK